MKLLHLLPTLDPRGGGPMEAARQMAEEATARGHPSELLTLDGPVNDFLQGLHVPVHAIGPSRTGYHYNPALVPWLRRHAGGYDAVVVHGLWGYHAFGAWRALHGAPTPYCVYPHGMLDPWFKRTYPLKHLKKRLYWPWADYRLLRDARAVLFTCEQERRLARESFSLYRAHEVVTAFGTRTPPQDAARLREHFLASHPGLRGKRLLLFLSRLHEKKGCDLLIEAWAKVAGHDPSLHLVMAGPDAHGLGASLQARAAQLGVADRIGWPGMLQGDAKWGAFHAAEAFVLPSHQENFGIVVAEALGCGLPVLITDQVNIWREVQQAGAGLVAPDTVEGCMRLLQDWLALPPGERQRMRERARRAFDEHFTVEAMTQSLIAALAQRMGQPTPQLASA
jgi:glycosyltransferase involved in cell wall biosynthesis